MHDLPEADFTQRFIFDDADVRGEAVALERSYAEVLAKHDYPLPVQLLLGEFMAAAALLVGTLKFDGLLILQARSEGPVPLLMIECSSERDIRGLARFHAEQINDTDGLPELMPAGTLAMTIDPTEGQRYQGIVDLEGADLSASFSNYFALSEQLGTRFWLKADGQRARGLLLQQLPAAVIKDEDDRAESWKTAITLADTLKAEELLGLDNETVPVPPVPRAGIAAFRYPADSVSLQLFQGAFGTSARQSWARRCTRIAQGASRDGGNRLPVLQPALLV